MDCGFNVVRLVICKSPDRVIAYRAKIMEERKDLDYDIDQEDWSRLIGYGIEFGSEACMSTSNYVSKDFAERYKIVR